MLALFFYWFIDKQFRNKSVFVNNFVGYYYFELAETKVNPHRLSDFTQLLLNGPVYTEKALQNDGQKVNG